MNKTAIDYLDYSWSPVTGCTPVSAGCANCWARAIHDRRHKAHLSGKRMPVQYSKPFSEVQLHSDRLEEPLHVRKPARIGVCFGGDLFNEAVPVTFLEAVLAVITRCPQHTFMVPTKRGYRLNLMTPDRLRISRTDTWPIRNLWLGVSISNQEDADRDVPLLQTPAALRFVSYEPALGPVNLDPLFLSPSPSTAFLDGRVKAGDPFSIGCVGIDWLIAGCESGPRRRHIGIDAFRSVRDQCIEAGIPFFLKQMEIDGKVIKMPMLDGRVWNEFPGARRG